MLKGNRAERQPGSRRGITPSGIPRCEEETSGQLAGEPAQPISSGGAAECHEGTSPMLQQFVVFCFHVMCISLGVYCIGLASLAIIA